MSGAMRTHVTVAGITGGCAAGRVVVYGSASPNAVVASGSGAVAGGAMVVTTAAFQAPTTAAGRAFVMLDGWVVPAAWTSTDVPAPVGPVVPGTASTVLSNLTWVTLTNNPVQVCFQVDVTTTSTTPVAWAVDVDLAQAPFNGQTTGYSLQGDNGWKYRLYASTPTVGKLQIRGDPSAWDPWTTVVAGQVRTVKVCNFGLPIVQTPSAYTVTSTPTTWTDTRACVATTVTGNGTSQFYVAWTAALDLQSAVARVQGSGKKIGFDYDRAYYDTIPSPAPAVGPYASTIVSKNESSIAGTQTFTFEACAVTR
jgi:hypothetical protein